MNKRHRRNYEHRDRLYPDPHRTKLNRSKRARGKIRVRILGLVAVNHRGRYGWRMP